MDIENDWAKGRGFSKSKNTKIFVFSLNGGGCSESLDAFIILFFNHKQKENVTPEKGHIAQHAKLKTPAGYKFGPLVAKINCDASERNITKTLALGYILSVVLPATLGRTNVYAVVYAAVQPWN